MATQNAWQRLWLASLLILLVALPWLGLGRYHMHLLILCFLNVLLGTAMNVIFGLAGQVSFAQAGFFGLGAYASGLIGVRAGLPFWCGFLVAGLVGALAGLVVGLPSLRLRGSYFVIVTLAFGMIMQQVFINWVDLTGGPMALLNVPGFSLPFGFAVVSRSGQYHLVLFLAALCVWGFRRLRLSPAGRALRAIRDDEELAASSGINVFHYKVGAFVLACVITSLAGSFYAHYISIVSPEVFGLTTMLQILAIVIVGGAGNEVGTILGSLVCTLLPETLRVVGRYREAVFGVTVMSIVVLMPGGGLKEFNLVRVVGQVRRWLPLNRRLSGLGGSR